MSERPDVLGYMRRLLDVSRANRDLHGEMYYQAVIDEITHLRAKLAVYDTRPGEMTQGRMRRVRK